ncbi:hypothetical protein [Edaphocola aurantiacus]|uniref:hypothetical protein n=1 Tax=Edaphocola aurantiacus TaxID=2601682 RepID=UPI001C9645BA|nr:hypothetical protein [Edaphocola aurantiacus]
MKKIYASLLILICSVKGFSQHTAPLKNSINIIPVATFYTYNWSMGIAYERLIDHKGRFGVNIPVLLAFMNDGFNVDAGVENSNRLQLNPGFRYYPVRNKTMTYGVGLSYYYFRGKIEYYGFGYYSGQTQYESWKYTIWQAGPMLNNYAGFNINEHFYVGIEVGVGVNIINKGKVESTGEVYRRNAEKEMFQTNFQIGYRF